MKLKFQEKGQVLIMIAVAGVVLLAFTSLAVDGTRVFSEKRHAQNAADAAALAAALAQTRGNDFQAEGFASAASNSFDNDISTNEVTVESCVNVVCPGLPAGADESEYVYVKIVIHVTTYLTRVVGWSQVTQAVDAVARAIPPYSDTIAYGNAVVALNKTDCRSFWGHGNSSMTTIGGGIFVNSDADCGFTLNGHPNLNTPSVTIAGSTSSPHESWFNYDAPQLPEMIYPNPSCGSAVATRVGNAMTPGRWTGAFPPNGVNHLSGGVYCINGEFRMNGNDTLTGSDVVIRMDGGGIAWNGNGAIQLSAPTVGPFRGLLIFVPPTNACTMKINGTNDQRLTGTILAPACDIELLGTAGTEGFNSQIIGYNVEFGGTFDGTVRFDESLNYHTEYGPQIEVTE